MFKQFFYNVTTFFRERKQDALVLIFAGILIIIIFVIVIISFFSSQSSQSNIPSQTTQIPSPTPSSETTSPTPVSPAFLNPNAAGRLGEKVANRQTLSDEDQTAKTTLLHNFLGDQTSGLVYETDNVQVQYVQEADEFTAEILTTNVAQAKIDAATWFTQQGFSHTGICNLPIMFFLGPEPASTLRDQPINFSPLPDGC